MATAFQRSAFQNNAFQIDGGQASGGGVGGGRIVGGTYSRGKWRKLQDELNAKIEAARALEAAKLRRKEELAELKRRNAEAQVRAAAALEAERAQQAREALFVQLLLDAAQGAVAGAQNTEANTRHVAMAAMADRMARAQREADEDEERAVEMLLDD
jgi:hypothetical protein